MEKAVRLIPRGFRIMVYVIIFNNLFKEFTYIGPPISTGEILEGGNLPIVASHRGIICFIY